MDNLLQSYSIEQAIDALNKKEVIAYPTESVFGVGCDPDSVIAIHRLLKLKNRSIERGFILISSDFKQLQPYIDDSSLTSLHWENIFSAWPGPVTFVFPAKKYTPYWLTGNFKSVAVRITSHPLIVNLCRKFGRPIISSSANFSGCIPCRTVQEVYKQFGNNVTIIYGKVGKNIQPSEIRDVITGKRFR